MINRRNAENFIEEMSHFVGASELVDRHEMERDYGTNQNNFGDLPNFQGGYINYGYWKDIPLNQPLTVEDRIQSSKNLYFHTLEALNLSDKDHVLELGCGRGRGLLNLIESFPYRSLTGIDILPAQIERTRQVLWPYLEKKYHVELRTAPADRTMLPDQSIDKIYSVEVIQHFKSIEPLAREIKRILRPGGKFVFASDLSVNQEGFKQLRHENLLIQGDVLLPIEQLVYDFEKLGFQVHYHSIGQHVFPGYEEWISQINCQTPCSHYIYKSFQKKYIDYFLINVFR